MVQPITLDEFENLVIRHFGFLEKDFDFLFKRITNDSYRAESSRAIIHIYLEYGVNLIVEIESAGEAASQLRRQNIIPETITLLSVCQYYDPSTKIREEPNSKHDVRLEMERQANLLKKHCQKILKGDFSDWSEIEKYLKQKTYHVSDL